MAVKDEIYQLVRLLDEIRAQKALRLLRILVEDEKASSVGPNEVDDRALIASSKPFTLDDPFWKMVGRIKDNGPTDVSENKYHYLAEAYADREDE